MADATEPVECEDCGQMFLLRQGSGPCPKCEKLKPHGINSEDYSEISVSLPIKSYSFADIRTVKAMAAVHDVWCYSTKSTKICHRT